MITLKLSRVYNQHKLSLKQHCLTSNRICILKKGYGVGLLKGMELDFKGYGKRALPDIAQLVERLTVDQLVACSIQAVRIWLEFEKIHISQKPRLETANLSHMLKISFSLINRGFIRTVGQGWVMKEGGKGLIILIVPEQKYKH